MASDGDSEDQVYVSGTSEESEQALLALEKISASCSPLTMSNSTFGALPGASLGKHPCL